MEGEEGSTLYYESSPHERRTVRTRTGSPCPAGMDPFSITAGVLGIAAAVCQASKQLVGLVGNIKGGPEQIQAISQDARAFEAIILPLQLALQNQHIIFMVCNNADLTRIIGNLTQPLRNCEAVLCQLKIKIEAHLKPTSDGRGLRMSKVDLKWGVSAKSQVKDLMTQLEATKTTLNVGLTSVIG